MVNCDESIILQKTAIKEISSEHKGKSERNTLLSKMNGARVMGPVMIEMRSDSKSCRWTWLGHLLELGRRHSSEEKQVRPTAL